MLPACLQEGVKAACMALAYGTAKDRKKALKCMKVSWRGAVTRGVVCWSGCTQSGRRGEVGGVAGADSDGSTSVLFGCARALLCCPSPLPHWPSLLPGTPPCVCVQGHVGAMARDEWGHLALITALSVVDDTTLLRKMVVSELQVGAVGAFAWVGGVGWG